MFKVIKNKGKVVQAYKLQKENETIKELIKNGKITDLGNGKYEVHSLETVGGKGEIAVEGDWIKIDGGGYPYPNSKDFFETHHHFLEGDTYEQLPSPLNAWNAECGTCPEIDYLIRNKKLLIDETSFEKRYSAELWGTREFAAGDAVIVFYRILYNTEGEVEDIDFNFVERKTFERTYSVL